MTSILEVEGGHPLTGSITVRGAKNFVPKAMVAALLATTPSELYNVPLIRDVDAPAWCARRLRPGPRRHEN